MTGILERVRRHALIDEKSMKSLVYTPPGKRIILPRRKLQRSIILATLRACREQMKDVDLL